MTGRGIAVAAVVLTLAGAPAWAGLMQVSQGTADTTSQASFISSGNLGHMVTGDFVARNDYSFQFGYGSKDVSDGSDLAAVRNAFSTWIDLPSSSLSAAEAAARGIRSLGQADGRNQITWVSADRFGTNAWTDKLGFEPYVIAAAVTWYYPNTGKVAERDIYFNDINMSWRTETDPAPAGAFSVEHIALHEIGHIYGLLDVYNPGQSGHVAWMGTGNESLTMYGYARWYDDGTTLSPEDIYAMALAHPAFPEPASVLLLAVGAVALRRCRISR